MQLSDRDGRLIEWFGKWRKPIRSWLRNRAGVSSGEVDDLSQEVFARLLKYSNGTEIDNPQGYLFRIAANVANEWRERSRVRRPHDAEWMDELTIETEDEPEEFWQAQDQQSQIQAAYDRLPQRQRMILLLHVNDGLTYKQIAARHQLTYRIVLRELTRAYAKLRIDLRDMADENNDRRSVRTHSRATTGAQPLPSVTATVVAESDVG